MARLPSCSKKDTRSALLEAAIEVFARLGYDGASNRVLATAADVNQALIAYHFGSKEGLYLAVFDEIAERVGTRLENTASLLESRLECIEASLDEGPDMAVSSIETFLCPYIRLMLDPAMNDVATLVIREQTRPTPAFDRLWVGVISRMLELLTRLVALAEGVVEPDDAHRIRALTLFGQVYILRSAKATVACHMGTQSSFDLAAHADDITAVIMNNVRNMFK